MVFAGRKRARFSCVFMPPVLNVFPPRFGQSDQQVGEHVLRSAAHHFVIFFARSGQGVGVASFCSAFLEAGERTLAELFRGLWGVP